ncbi:MAG TPA: hypothetical protein PKM73_18565 [Verrucomicrobiota bacterium]|nr:hypothetical protein [Verrucomicrobiota bacterium]HNU52915.1 hypothetical protein [Verrucomicrobiota bacterium]
MNDAPLRLEEAPATNLEVFVNPSDLRQDVQAFMDYARGHQIKRGHRDNGIPRAHQQQLAKRMSNPAGARTIDPEGGSAWIGHVDGVCLALKLVKYDTKGVYAGYSSVEPSFPDNFVQVDERAYHRFLKLPLAAQEEAMLALHLEGADLVGNEFFSRGPLSRSDTFDHWGSATGVVPTIPFPKVRRHLLELLARCPVGVWLRTASLVEYLRLNEPWFLIPKEIPIAVRATTTTPGRYGNFIERKRGDWGDRKPISSKDPEGFAKVEGRYIERFLEGIPLVLGYTDVAYRKQPGESEIEPSRGVVPAFRVTERLRQAIRREITPPKVTVLPNFEVHVESLFFSAQTDVQLHSLGELIQRGIVTLFRLSKTRVGATLAAKPGTDPIGMLEGLSGRPLPPNVRQELRDWAGHSEKFILYEGFSVLEGPRDTAALDPFVVEPIAPHLALVRKAQALYQQLEAAELVPLRIRHAATALATPANVKSALAPAAPPRRVPAKTALRLKRSVQTTLWFTDAAAHAEFSRMLLDAKCVVPTDRRALTVSYPRSAEPLVKECLKRFGQEYRVEVDDLET